MYYLLVILFMYTSLALIKFITKYSYKTLHGYLAEHKVKAIKNENDDEQ